METTYTYSNKEAKKKIKKYITGGSGKLVRVFAWILGLLSLFALTQCTLFRRSDDVSAAQEFNPVLSRNGSYAYIDISGVSDWAYKRTVDSAVTVYYFAEDADGYFYTITLEDDEISKMSAQRDWWDRDDDSGKAPDPYRVYGKVRGIPSNLKGEFADFWEMDEGTFEDYFGDSYLDVGSSPAQDANTGWTVATVFFGFIWLACALLSRNVSGSAKKALKALEKRGELAKAASEMDSPESIVVGSNKGGRGILSPSYVFGNGTGTVLRYEDILWAYCNAVSNRYVTTSYIVGATADKKRISLINLGNGDNSQLSDHILGIIEQRNPRAVFGFSRDAKKQYKELVKEVKAGK